MHGEGGSEFHGEINYDIIRRVAYGNERTNEIRQATCDRYSLPSPRFYSRTRKAIRPGLPAAASASDHANYQPNPTPLPIPFDILKTTFPDFSPIAPFDNIHNRIGLPLSTTSNSGTHLRACLGWHRASCCGHTQCSGCAAADRRGREGGCRLREGLNGRKCWEQRRNWMAEIGLHLSSRLQATEGGWGGKEGSAADRYGRDVKVVRAVSSIFVVGLE
jgi:hypothetical protein